MGQALTWIAVRGKDAIQVLADLDASPTGEHGALGEHRFAACPLRGGWYAVAATEAGHRWGGPDWLAALSAGAELVACQVQEQVMFASAEGWRAGERRWRVVRDAQQGLGHLQAEGELPPAYAGIAAEHRALMMAAPGSQVDHLFEVPLKLAQRLTGFKHDEGGPGGDSVWSELSDGPVRTVKADKPWWKRW